MGLICRLFGHRWTDPSPLLVIVKSPVCTVVTLERYCLRCFLSDRFKVTTPFDILDGVPPLPPELYGWTTRSFK